MKAMFVLFALATAPLFAADASRLLLSGATVSVEDGTAIGTARAVVGDMTIAADAITFEKQTGTLKCDGPVTIRVLGSVVTARDCVIQLSPGDKKLFFLSRGEIQVSSPSYFPPASTDLVGRSSEREKLILEFRARMHDQESEIRFEAQQPPNKSVQPTPGSVTPRASEGTLK